MTSLRVAAKVQILRAEAERAARASSSWSASHTYSVRRWQEELERERAEKETAALAKMQAFYDARLAKKNAAALKAATSGPGWKVLSLPFAQLEGFAKRLWHDGLCGIPWPTGWKVRWGNLRGRNAVGMCVYESSLILIDADALGSFRAPGEQLVQTLVHELAHSQHRADSHGAAFQETLRRLLAVVLPEVDDTPLEAASAPARPHPEPKRGLFRGTAVTWPGAAEFEFR